MRTSILRIGVQMPSFKLVFGIEVVYKSLARRNQVLDVPRAIYRTERTDTGVEGTTEGRKQNINKSKSWKIGEIKYRQYITCWNCNQKGHFHNQCSKLVASRDKVVKMIVGDSNNALVCCVENTVEDRIMDFGASFHATYCKEELERFKLHSSKVRLADDITLDITGVGDVVLKTSFGTSWTLKDVRYILSLKRRLILVGQLDEEGYHVAFRDQQWKVTKGSLVIARGNKRRSLFMVEVHPEGIDAIIDGSGSATLWFGEAEEAFLHIVREDKETTKVGASSRSYDRYDANLQFGVAERLSRTFRAECTGLPVEASKMLWADSVFGCDSFVKVKDVCGESMKCTFIGSGSDEMRYSFRDTKNHQVIRSRDFIFVDSIYEASLGGSPDTSEGFENSKSFKDSGRSDEEYSEDGASSKEGGSETPLVPRSNIESRAPVRYSPLANYLLLTENGKPESYSEALSSKESVQ
ncbi:retrovirus-related pol polyprotein from transposon TNT 1-94 [Tanacetum coccineum]